MSFFPHYAPFFLFSAPSKWNVFFRITEIGANKLRLHAPFTMDIIKGRLLFDAFSDVFMSCICFADTVNICGNKHIFIVIVISSLGNTPCENDRLVRRVKGIATWSDIHFNPLDIIPSLPGAPSFNCAIIFFTSESSTGLRKNNMLFCCGIKFL